MNRRSWIARWRGALALGPLLLLALPARAQLPPIPGGASGTIINAPFNCATSSDGQVVGLGNPLTVPVLGVLGPGVGTLPPGTYYVEYSFFDFAGNETLVSPEEIESIGYGYGITVQLQGSGLPQNAAGIRVYIGARSGAETLQGVATGNNAFNQTIPLAAGTLPPATNSTLCMVVSNGAIWPGGTGFNVTLTDSAGDSIPGYPMQWQFATPGTTINLSQGLPYYHGQVFFPIPILATPPNHGSQSIAGALSLGSYALYAGSINATSFSTNGAAGFTGTKTIGGCTLTISSGLITNVTGC